MECKYVDGRVQDFDKLNLSSTILECKLVKTVELWAWAEHLSSTILECKSIHEKYFKGVSQI